MSHMETTLPSFQAPERRHCYLPIWGSLVPVGPNINTLAGIHLSLGITLKYFYGLGMCELFVKVAWLQSEPLPLFKKEYNSTPTLYIFVFVFQSSYTYVHIICTSPFLLVSLFSTTQFHNRCIQCYDMIFKYFIKLNPVRKSCNIMSHNVSLRF